MIQLTLTLNMTNAQVVKTSATINKSPIQDYVGPDDHTQPTFEMTPGFKPFTTTNMFLCENEGTTCILIIINLQLKWQQEQQQ